MQEKFVFFDLGNVLVYFDHDIAVRNVSRLMDRGPDQVKRIMFASGLQDRLETGEITSEQFAESLIEQLVCQHPTRAVLDAISAIFQPNLEMIDLLDQLKCARIPMAILSNTCEPHWQWLLRQNWPVIGQRFEFFVLSYEARSMKPDSRIYQVSEERCGRRPESIFFTDDRLDNVDAARARGWTTHQFSSPQLLAQELGDWLGITLNVSNKEAAEPAR